MDTVLSEVHVHRHMGGIIHHPGYVDIPATAVCPGSDSIPVYCFLLLPAHPASLGQGISVTATVLSGSVTCSSPYGRKNEGFSKCGPTSHHRQLSINGYADATAGHAPMCGSP